MPFPLLQGSQHPRGEEGEDGQWHDAFHGEKAAPLVARNVFAVPSEAARALIGGHAAVVDLVEAFALGLGEVAAVPLVERTPLVDTDRRIGGGGPGDDDENERGEDGEERDGCRFHGGGLGGRKSRND